MLFRIIGVGLCQFYLKGAALEKCMHECDQDRETKCHHLSDIKYINYRQCRGGGALYFRIS